MPCCVTGFRMFKPLHAPAIDVWEAIERDCDNETWENELLFTRAFPDHWFLCNSFRSMHGDEGELDSDACMCALAAVQKKVKLGLKKDDVKVRTYMLRKTLLPSQPSPVYERGAHAARPPL